MTGKTKKGITRRRVLGVLVSLPVALAVGALAVREYFKEEPLFYDLVMNGNPEDIPDNLRYSREEILRTKKYLLSSLVESGYYDFTCGYCREKGTHAYTFPHEPENKGPMHEDCSVPIIGENMANGNLGGAELEVNHSSWPSILASSAAMRSPCLLISSSRPWTTVTSVLIISSLSRMIARPISLTTSSRCVSSDILVPRFLDFLPMSRVEPVLFRQDIWTRSESIRYLVIAIMHDGTAINNEVVHPGNVDVVNGSPLWHSCNIQDGDAYDGAVHKLVSKAGAPGF